MPFATAEAYAPATLANLGVGFDVLGLALHEPGDTVIAERRDEPGAEIIAIEGDGGRLPREADRNTACVAANSVLRAIGAQQGVALTLHKNLPLSSGMGSSAASSVAAAVAVNALFGSPLDDVALFAATLDGEAVASGYHPDNVGPSLFGGITMFTSAHADAMTRLPVPGHLHIALVTPQVEVHTADARAVLPEVVPLKTVVKQTASIAALVDALHRGDVRMVGRVMECDFIIEPARAHLMPYLEEVRAAAKAAGAHGTTIGGAGPTLFSVCASAEIARDVAAAMAAIYHTNGIDCVARHDQVSREGARVLRCL